MSLGEYKKKRDFRKTKEPAGTDSSPSRLNRDPQRVPAYANPLRQSFSEARASAGRVGSQKLIYVIQKHDASHLHYDLRLEMDGILKSWAVPKEPPIIPEVKRLAVAVEDHPLGYETFEGIIPEGEYGAGTVEIWDKGYYKILEQTAHSLIFEIYGQKLKGIYCLIRLISPLKFKTPDNKGKNWLFFKKK